MSRYIFFELARTLNVCTISVCVCWISSVVMLHDVVSCKPLSSKTQPYIWGSDIWGIVRYCVTHAFGHNRYSLSLHVHMHVVRAMVNGLSVKYIECIKYIR